MPFSDESLFLLPTLKEELDRNGGFYVSY